jgi:hypothetical protein
MEEIIMSEVGAEVEAATRAFEAMIGAQLAAGADRCLLAATCIWGGVKEMTEVTSSESAAAALRTIADQIDPSQCSEQEHEARPIITPSLRPWENTQAVHAH